MRSRRGNRSSWLGWRGGGGRREAGGGGGRRAGGGEVAEQAEAWRGDVLHSRMHDLKATMGLPPQEAFSAIYRAFLGKDSGPQAGWLLAALDRDFALRRLREAAGTRTAS